MASAQCRSSMTSRTGLSAASSDSRLSTAPNICWRARPAQSASLVLPVAVGQQARQHRAGLDGLLDARRRGAERVRERQVRDAVADLRALAAQHGEAVALGDLHRLGDQAGLADSRVAADEPGDRAARRGVVQEAAQPGQLRVPSHQRAHVSIIRRGPSVTANRLGRSGLRGPARNCRGEDSQARATVRDTGLRIFPNDRRRVLLRAWRQSTEGATDEDNSAAGRGQAGGRVREMNEAQRLMLVLRTATDRYVENPGRRARHL